MSELDTNDSQHKGTQMPDTESKDDRPTDEAQPPPTKVVTWSSAEMEAAYWQSVEAAVRSSFKAKRKPEDDTNQKDEG